MGLEFQSTKMGNRSFMSSNNCYRLAATKRQGKINGSRMLLEDSFCDCILEEKINIFLIVPAAVKFSVGEGKMPTDYIKEGFDWLAEQEKQNKKQEISFTRLDETSNWCCRLVLMI